MRGAFAAMHGAERAPRPAILTSAILGLGGEPMRRRDFINLLASTAAGWPLAARAQQSSRLRRVGVLMTFAADDPDGQANFAALAQGLQEFGWTVGRNLRLDYRWGANDLDRFRTYAAELITLSPDVVVATAGSVVTAFQQASRTVP